MIATIAPQYAASLPLRERRQLWKFSVEEGAPPVVATLTGAEKKLHMDLAAICLATALTAAVSHQGASHVVVAVPTVVSFLDREYGLETNERQVPLLMRIINQLPGVTVRKLA